MQHISSCDSRPRRPLARWYGLALLLALVGLGRPLASQAQAPKAGAAPSFFQADAAAAARGSAGGPAGRALLLDTTALRALLRQVPAMGASARGGVGTGVLMALPMPDGSTGRFRIYETSVMAPALAARYPQIKTYSGIGVDDPTASVALDMTPLGFHAQVLSGTTGTTYIEPVGDAAALQYRSTFARDVARPTGSAFSCNMTNMPTSGGQGKAAAPSGDGLAQRIQTSNVKVQVLRLAVACTPEYAAYFTSMTKTTSQNKVAVLSAISTTVNAVSAIYAKELSIQLQLIDNNDAFIFLTTPASPLTAYDQANTSQMLTTNQSNISAILRQNGKTDADYDIGHVFSTASSGLAQVGSVGKTFKARGVSGVGTFDPKGLFFYNVVMHEMGHQLGAQHVFNGTNGTCSPDNYHRRDAVEPGSGSTIMAYGGECGDNNFRASISVNFMGSNLMDYLTQFQDSYFNAKSYTEIQAYMATVSTSINGGNSQDTGNVPPVISTILMNGFRTANIPTGTPFWLMLNTTATTSTNPSSLTYCWEETDKGIQKNLTTMSTQRDNDKYPLFRSQKPTTETTRYFPSINNILLAQQGNNIPEETLPSVERNMNFVCTARDLNTVGIVPNGSAVSVPSTVGGVAQSSGVTLIVESGVSFKITTTGKTHLGATPRVYLTWTIAGTNTGDINCNMLQLSEVTNVAGKYVVTFLQEVSNTGTAELPLTYGNKLLLLGARPTENCFFNIGKPDNEMPASTVKNTAATIPVKSVIKSVFGSLFKSSSTSSSAAVGVNSATTSGSAAGIANQLQGWTTEKQVNGLYSFLYQGDPSMALDVSNVLYDAGTGIRTTTYDPSSLSQQFLLQDVGDGRFRIFAGDDSGRLLEAYTPTGSTTPAVRLVPYVALASATDGQKWNLNPVYDDIIPGQVYNLQFGNGSNLLTTGTSAVQLATQNDGTATAQRWTVNQSASGYFTFTSAATTKLLTVVLTVGTPSVTTATANAATTTANPQYFKLEPSAPGYYKLLNVAVGVYLVSDPTVSGGLSVVGSAASAGTDWQFIDGLLSALPVTIANSSNSTTTKYLAPSAATTGSTATLSGTPTGWTVSPSVIVGTVVVGAALTVAFAGPAVVAALNGAAAGVSFTQLTAAVSIIGTAANIGVGLSLQTPISGTRRALLATNDGTLAQTYRLGLLSNGKYLIFDYNGDHVMTLQTDGSITEADYTGAANQQWDLAPTAPLTATLYSPGIVFGEYSQTFGIGDYATLVGSTVGNDVVSRLDVPTGLNVTLYEDANFAGNSWNFRSNTNQLPTGAQRKISSVRVRAINDVLQDGALYKIVSRSGSGNQVMQVGTGDLVSVVNSSNVPAQYWRVKAGGSQVPEWTFIAQSNTGKCLDVKGYDSALNTPIWIYDNGKTYVNLTPSQSFRLTPTSDGYFQIITTYTDTPILCVQNTVNGVQLGANRGTGNPTQEWRFERVNPAATVYETASTTYTGGGYAIQLANGRYTSAQLTALGATANTISALKVSPDYEIIFFADDNFVGQSWRYQADVSDLASVGGNNTVESIIVRPRTDGLVNGQLYTIANASTGTLLQATGNTASSVVSVGSAAADQVTPNQLWKATQVGVNWAFSPQNAPLSALANNGSKSAYPYLSNTTITNAAHQFQLIPVGNGNFQLYTALGIYSLGTSKTQTFPFTKYVALADPVPTSLAQQWRFDVFAPVTVYVGASYTGAISLKTGTYSLADLRNLGIVQTSDGALQPGSLRVADGYEVVLYNADGATGTLVGDYFTNQPALYTSCRSLLVRLAPVGGTVYTADAYQGTAAPLSEGDYTGFELQTRGLAANDVSSLKVPTGYEMLLFDQDNFTGPLWNFRVDHSDLALDVHGHQAADLTESVMVRKIVTPVSGATYWIQPVQTPSLALGSGTGMANGPVSATTFDYTQNAQQWVVEADALGLWSLHQPGANYLDATDQNAGTALAYGSPGFFPQTFDLVNVTDNIWRIATRNGRACATLQANNTISLATPLAFNEPTQCWYLSRVSNGNTKAMKVAAGTKVPDRVTLYPNPATATITLQDLPAGATVTILDLLGQTMLTSTQAVISIAPLPPGVYIAVVGQQRVRFIKQ